MGSLVGPENGLRSASLVSVRLRPRPNPKGRRRSERGSRLVDVDAVAVPSDDTPHPVDHPGGEPDTPLTPRPVVQTTVTVPHAELVLLGPLGPWDGVREDLVQQPVQLVAVHPGVGVGPRPSSFDAYFHALPYAGGARHCDTRLSYVMLPAT